VWNIYLLDVGDDIGKFFPVELVAILLVNKNSDIVWNSG